MFLRPVLSTLGKRIASPLACRSNSTVPESKRGNVYELRTYTILPSKMREYQKVVEEVLPVRMKQSQLNGSWYTEIGNLNEVFYLWEYGKEVWYVDGRTFESVPSLCIRLHPQKWSPFLGL